jgi:hypothetical protein
MPQKRRTRPSILLVYHAQAGNTVEHVINQGHDLEDEPPPPPSKTWVKNFMRAHKDFHMIKWKPMDKKRRAAQDTSEKDMQNERDKRNREW